MFKEYITDVELNNANASVLRETQMLKFAAHDEYLAEIKEEIMDMDD